MVPRTAPYFHPVILYMKKTKPAEMFPEDTQPVRRRAGSILSPWLWDFPNPQREGSSGFFLLSRVETPAMGPALAWSCHAGPRLWFLVLGWWGCSSTGLLVLR
jgi:hypothetical protein